MKTTKVERAGWRTRPCLTEESYARLLDDADLAEVYEEKIARLERLLDCRRPYPVMEERPPIKPVYVPWGLMEVVSSRCLANHDQTPAHLAARGGMSIVEIYAALEGKTLREVRGLSPESVIPHVELRVKEYLMGLTQWE